MKAEKRFTISLQ